MMRAAGPEVMQVLYRDLPELSRGEGYRSRSSGVLMLRTDSGATATSTVTRPPSARCSDRSPAANATRRCGNDETLQMAQVGSRSAAVAPRPRRSRTPGARPERRDRRGGGRADRRRRRRRPERRRETGRRSANRSSAAENAARAGPRRRRRSGTTVRPSGASSSASPPAATTCSHPAARSASATRTAIGTPSTSTSAFVRPMRRLAPPVRTAPIRRRVTQSAGIPDGSSWSRNRRHRSASSASPITAAISPSPRRQRRKPRLVGSDHRTYPLPRHPLARSVSRPR